MEPQYTEVAGYPTRLDCGLIDIHMPSDREIQEIKTGQNIAYIHYSREQSLNLVDAGMEIIENNTGQKNLFGYVNFDTPHRYDHSRDRSGRRTLGSKLLATLSDSAIFNGFSISQEGSVYTIHKNNKSPIHIATTVEGNTGFVEFMMEFDNTTPGDIIDFKHFCHAWGISQNTIACLDPASDVLERGMPIAQIFIGTDTYDEPLSQTELILRSTIDKLHSLHSNSIPTLDRYIDAYSLQTGEQSYQLSLDDMHHIATSLITAKRRKQQLEVSQQTITEEDILDAMDATARHRSESPYQ